MGIHPAARAWVWIMFRAFRIGRKMQGTGTRLHLLAPFAAAALLLTGCGTARTIFGESTATTSFSESNYVTYDHVFTDAAADAVRKSARQHCGLKKQVAIKTTSACSLTRCNTSYQCMDRQDVPEYQK